MAKAFTFELKGVQAEINRLAQIGGDIAEEVDLQLAAGSESIKEAAQKKTSENRFTGNLDKSIGVIKLDNLRYEIAATAYHAPYVEFGTRGKVKIPAPMREVAATIKKRPKKGSFKEMVAALKEWGRKRKYFKTEQAATMVAFSILKNGLAPRPFLYPSFMENRSKIVQNIKKVLDEKSG